MALGSIQFGTGAASGIDFRAIVDAILNVERLPVQRLESKIQAYESSKGVLGNLDELLQGLQGKVATLKSAESIGGKIATLSDENASFAATVSPSALEGAYSIEVSQIATASRVRSETFDDAFSPIVGDGSITLQAGSNEAFTIDVSAAQGNNSLQAIADSINAEDKGVRASIIQDGVGSILVVRSEETGAANALTITDTTDLGLGDPANVLQTAQDALLTVDGIAVQSSSNTVKDSIAGVTLELTGPTDAPVTLNIERDEEGTKQAIKDFVEAYNELNEFYNTQFGEVENKQGASLSASSAIRNILSTIQGKITGSVEGIPSGNIQSLAEIGVRVADRTGQLEFVESVFDDIVEQGRYGEISSVLASEGNATDPAAVFVAAVGNAAQPGTYAIQITQAAERADVGATTAVALTGIAQDETLTLTVNGESVDVNLLAGDTIETVVSKVNTALSGAGVEGRAYDEGGALRFRAAAYGASYTISAVSNVADAGDGSSTGIGTTELTDTGADVAGTIGGYAAEGSGQELLGSSGTPVEGLIVQIYATAESVASKSGDFGDLTYSGGVLSALDSAIDDITDPFEGTIKSLTDGFDKSIENFEGQIERLELRLAKREELLVLQFAAAETAISQLQQLQSQIGSGVPGTGA